MADKKMMIGLLARMKPKADDDESEFDTAAKEFAKAIKAGSEAEISETLRNCIDIAFTENEEKPHKEYGD